MRLSRPVVVAAGFLLTSLILTTNTNALETFRHVDSRTFEIGSSPHISIEALSGNASYYGSDAATASVEIIYDIDAKDQEEADAIRAKIELLVDGQPGFLDLRLLKTREFHEWLREEYSRRHNVSVSFKVTGPRGAEGIIESVSGDAAAVDITGPIEVASVSGNAIATDIERNVTAGTVSGNVDVERADAMVTAESVSGNVTVADCGGDADIESTSGNIRALNVGGAVSAETVSGGIDVRGASLGVDAESTSGSVWIENLNGNVTATTTSGDIELMTRTNGDIDLESLSGSVSLAVVAAGFGKVTLSANSGEIESELPITVKRQSRGRLEGTLGSGTAVLRVSTNSGDITLSEL